MFKASIIEAAAASCGQRVTDANEADHQEPTGAYAVVMEAFKLKEETLEVLLAWESPATANSDWGARRAARVA